MKNIVMYIAILGLAVFVSCAGPKGDKAKVTEADTIVANTEGADQFNIDPSGSMVEWTGYKPTGQHNGTLNIKSGALYLSEGIPVGGEFIIDMQSIKVLDLEDPDMNGKLTGHLRSADFFDVDNHSEGKFVITRIVKNKTGSPAYTLSGNLTIKNITKSISFGADIQSDGATASGKTPPFSVDRTDFEIKYKSNKFIEGLKDDFINDEFSLAITIVGKKPV